MSNGSPTAYLLWSILSTIFLIFLVVHLWLYDKFNCVRWDSGRQPGAFRRVMTYSYLGTVPLLVVFSIAMTTIKFQEGYSIITSSQIIPRPLQLWTPQHRQWLLPLNIVLSIAWSLELVTHLEELAFWLFLLHQGPGKRSWFESWEYRAWYLGSMLAVLGVPLTAVVARGEIEKTQAWIFLVGSLAGTSTTVCFIYVLFRFPAFIRHVREGGAEPDIVVRLAIFYSLNRIRVVFRFIFTIPLFIIALDALYPPYPIISSPFALDFLLMIGGIGCFVSSAITLFVFFPRYMTSEAGYMTKAVSPPHSVRVPTSILPEYHHHEHANQAHLSLHLEEQFDNYQSTAKSFTHFPPSPTYHYSQSYFGYGKQPNLPPPEHCAHHEMSLYATPRESVEITGDEGEESESSPDYEFEDLSSMDISSTRRASHTSVSQPMSDDTVWDRQSAHRPTAVGTAPSPTHAISEGLNVPITANFLPAEDSGLQRSSSSPAPLPRRHSGTAFSSKRHSLVLRPNAGCLSMSEDENTREFLAPRATRRDMEAPMQKTKDSSGHTLHPYVMNWTSPIDLLDVVAPSNCSRMV